MRRGEDVGRRHFVALDRIVELDICVGHVATADCFAVQADWPADRAAQELESRNFDFALVRDGDELVRFVRREDLRSGLCRDVARVITVVDVTHATVPLLDFVEVVVRRRVLFVSAARGVHSILTPSDLQKVPARMMLFGLVTLLEMRLRDLVRLGEPPIDLAATLSPTRLEKALSFQEKRAQRGQELCLLECLQFCDLRDVCARRNLIEIVAPGSSRSWFEAQLDAVIGLRDSVAHASDFDPCTLPDLIAVIRAMVGRMEQHLQTARAKRGQ